METTVSRRQTLRMAGAAALAAIGPTAGGCALAGGSDGSGAAAGAYKDGRYVLPELPYSYDALEPLYEERTLRIHHTKHHAGYVKGLNSTLEKLDAARRAGDYGSIKELSRALAFHGSGHILHCLFWQSMKPGTSGMPAPLAKVLEADFGSVDTAKAQLGAAAKEVEGSGWAVLAYEPVGAKLVVLQVEKHQNLTVWGATPLLVCDVWEHAYYLQYANNRGLWVDNFLNLANWSFAAQRLAQAK
jgi:Fe-Mn family superoxide dismutase